MAAEDQGFVMLDASDVQGFNEEGLLPLSTEELSAVRTWLAPTDYDAASSEFRKHSGSHLAGTGAWIFSNEQYQQWHKSKQGALWLKAIAGAGKSVIAASLISKLSSEENAPVLYFFFRQIVSANQKPESLVRDYVTQALKCCPDLQHNLYRLVKDRRSLDSVPLKELWEMLVSALARLPRVYCVIDALDEMDAGNESFMTDLLEIAQKKSAAIKLLTTSRPLPRIEKVLRHPKVLQINLQPQFIDPDISVYVKHRLNRCNAPENFRSQIHQTMCTIAAGHFLYARLMMDELLDSSKDLLSCEEKLRPALERLPTPMADMYSQMLVDHSQRSGVSQDLQLTILQWVTQAERPLRLLELSSMIDFQQAAHGITKETKHIVREGCGPLLEILEDETVCPIHHSFTEYLYDSARQDIDPSTMRFPLLNYEDAQRTIAITCIRYLASGWYSRFPAQSEEIPQIGGKGALRLKYPFLDYAMNHWYKHLLKSGAQDGSIAAEVDSFVVNEPDAMRAWLNMTTERSPMNSTDLGSFQTWTPLHAAADRGLCFYVEHLIEAGHDIECCDSEQQTPIARAALNGHEDVVEVHLRHHARNDEADNVGLKPMHHAASRNHHGVVRLLLLSGVDPYTPKTKEYPGRFCGNAPTSVGDTPVRYACSNGHVQTVGAFVPFLQGEKLDRALYWALRFGRTETVKLLLKAPGVDVNCVVENQTPLYLASIARDLELMRLLLHMGADPHALSSNYFSHGGVPLGRYCYGRQLNSLQAFATGRDDECVKTWDVMLMKNGFEILLDNGLDPNTRDPNGLTILHNIMSSKGRLHNIETRTGIDEELSMLLDGGLEADLQTPDGSNAFHIASGISTSTIDMLIARGVDVNHVRKSDGKTPLITAIQKKDLDFARNLLDRGADANLADSEGNTPLHFLALVPPFYLKIDIVKTVLSAGADVNGRNKDGNTPMHLGEVNPELLSMFLEHGFDLESKNKSGHTRLFQVISGWNSGEPHKKLLDLGASPFTRDYQGSTVLHGMLGNISLNASDLVRFFVQRGVDPLTTDHYGNTLWHVVARQGASYHQQEQLVVMRLLMEYNVPLMARNNAGQTPLHIAFSVNPNQYPYGPIEFLLEHTHADVNVADFDKIRPIHLTSSFDANLTCRLLELGANPTVVTIEGQTPLMVACRARQCNTVCALLQHHQKHNQMSLVNQVDNQGRSALHYACKSGRPETVALLLEVGADANIKDKQQLTPLHACTEYLDEQATWNNPKNLDQTRRPMNAAYVLLTDHTRPKSGSDEAIRDPIRIRETIRLLVANGANTSFLTTVPVTTFDFSYRSKYTSDPLMQAVIKGKEQIVSELLMIQEKLLETKILDLESNEKCAEDTGGENKKSIDIVKKYWADTLNRYDNRIHFLKMWHMPDILVKEVNPGKNNVHLIQKLLREDDEPAVTKASELGANFMELDNGGNNPLFQMAAWGFADLMRSVGQDAARMHVAWTKEMAPLNVNWREGRLHSILHTALNRSIPNMEVVRLLVTEFKLDPNKLYSSGSHDPVQSFVHLVARPSHWWQTKALDLLLENGAEIEILNSNEETPLVHALKDPYRKVRSPARARAVEILLQHGANPNATDQNGLTCLNIASEQPHFIRLLLKSGANPAFGLRPFIFDAVKEQALNSLQFLVDAGVNMNGLPQPSPPAEGRKKNAQKAWLYQSDLDKLSEHAYPVHVAASKSFNTPEKKEKATQIIKLLLSAGADPFLVYKDGSSIIHDLAEHGGIIEPFFCHPSFDTECQDQRGRTLLLTACDAALHCYDSSQKPLPSLLLEHGASVSATDRDGRNALHCLITAPRDRNDDASAISSLAQMFLPTLISMPDSKGRTPFHYAVATSHFEFIDLLISHGADPLAPDPLNNTTALHHLAPHLISWEDAIVYNPAAVVIPDTQTELIEQLGHEPPFDPDTLRQWVRTKYMTPEQVTRSELRSPYRHIDTLLTRGLSIDTRDHTGETPLFKLMLGSAVYADSDIHAEPSRGILPVLQDVFEPAGADFKARNRTGESVLHRLAGRANSSLAPSWGRPPEPNRAEEDLKAVFRYLVGKGVDVAWEDDGGRTCLDVAAATGAEWMLELCRRN